MCEAYTIDMCLIWHRITCARGKAGWNRCWVSRASKKTFNLILVVLDIIIFYSATWKETEATASTRAAWRMVPARPHEGTGGCILTMVVKRDEGNETIYYIKHGAYTAKVPRPRRRTQKTVPKTNC